MRLIVNDLIPGEHLPDIIAAETSPNSVQLLLSVKETLSCFAGHFPGYPILPGVVQLDWAVTFAREYLSKDSPVTRLERLKFTNPIQPQAQLFLTLELDQDRDAVNFRYHNNEQSFSTGRLNYV